MRSATTLGCAIASLLLGGGVTANTRFRQEMIRFAERHGLALVLPAPQFCIDNGAMIAGLGFQLFEAGRTSGLDLQAVPTTSA